LRKQVGTQSGCNANTIGPRLPTREAMRSINEALYLFLNPVTNRYQFSRCNRGSSARPSSLKQFNAQGFLKGRYLGRKRGLRDPKPLRRPAKASNLTNGLEVGDLSQTDIQFWLHEMISHLVIDFYYQKILIY
jgi:hypothetical protein